MGDIDDINTFFQAADLDRNGYIDKEKLQRICPHLTLAEIDTIFHDLGKGQDNRIYLKELIQSPELDKQNVSDYECNKEERMTQKQINEIFNTLTCQEQIYDFYESLRNGSSDSVEQFQSILEVVVCDILKYRKEIKRLEDSFKREKDTNEKYLRNIEEDQERDMHQLEEKVRQEERQKFEVERQLLEQRRTKEVNDLQSSLQRLRTIEQVHTDRKSGEDNSIVLLRQEIAKLSEENQTLNSSLNDSLTTNAILESEIQSYKTQLNERQHMLLQEKQSSSSNHREKESLQTNVRHLVEVNKQLRDENDSLRVVLEKTRANAAAAVAANATPTYALKTPTRMVSTPGSTLGSYWNKSKLDSPSPSYITTAFQQKPGSFDFDSVDEIGILGREYPLAGNLEPTVTSNKSLSVPTVTNSLDADAKNTMNDSGLSLTVARDTTEFESGHDSKGSKDASITNVKQLRPLLTKRNNDDTDSDDVFMEFPLDRNQAKRVSQPRSTKRTNNNARSTKQQTTQSPATTRANAITMPDPQQDLVFDRMYKIVFCGDASVGKTTLIMRLCKGKFVSNVNTTLGVDFQNKQIEVDGKHVALQLWDTAGQERFRSIAKSYFRRCDGVILVYDSTYERSFLNVREWIDTITDATPKKVSILIVANKIDLRDDFRAEGKRVIEHAEGARLAKEYNALFIETSAKDGTNSNEALTELARDMQTNEDLERVRSAAVDLGKSSKKSTCCGN